MAYEMNSRYDLGMNSSAYNGMNEAGISYDPAPRRGCPTGGQCGAKCTNACRGL